MPELVISHQFEEWNSTSLKSSYRSNSSNLCALCMKWLYHGWGNKRQSQYRRNNNQCISKQNSNRRTDFLVKDKRNENIIKKDMHTDYFQRNKKKNIWILWKDSQPRRHNIIASCYTYRHSIVILTWLQGSKLQITIRNDQAEAIS